MTLDRQQLAHFWTHLSLILEQVGRLVSGDTRILSHRMGFRARKLIRMAVFMLRRMIVLEALQRLSDGEEAPVFPAKPRANAPAQKALSDRDQLPQFSMRLIEPLASLHKHNAVSGRTLKPHPHDAAPQIDGVRLRLKLEGLQKLIDNRHARAARLMAWFAARKPGQHCTPWRWARCAHLRHREFGDIIRDVLDLSEAATNRYYEDNLHPP